MPASLSSKTKRNNLIGTLALCLAMAWPTASHSASAQDLLRGTGKDACSFDENMGFEYVIHTFMALRTHQIRDRFIQKPAAGADEAEINGHFVYSEILGRFAAAQVSKSLERQCAFSAGTRFRLSLFLPGSRANGPMNLRSANSCVRSLSEFIQNAPIDQASFAKAVDETTKNAKDIIHSYEYNSHAQIVSAIEEAYRHIYLPGSEERIFFDLVPEDYQKAEYDGFVAWFKSQQNALRGLVNGTSSPATSSHDPANTTSQSDDDCVAVPNVSVRKINTDHYGWSYKSIIMIKNAHKSEVALAPDPNGAIENPLLRGLCASTSERLSDFPWNEMVGHIWCMYDQLNQDRWLILYEAQTPRVGADVGFYAQDIAAALRTDKCVHRDTQVFVVNFSQQR
jgi:hypothetical protein